MRSNWIVLIGSLYVRSDWSILIGSLYVRSDWNIGIGCLYGRSDWSILIGSLYTFRLEKTDWFPIWAVCFGGKLIGSLYGRSKLDRTLGHTAHASPYRLIVCLIWFVSGNRHYFTRPSSAAVVGSFGQSVSRIKPPC